MADLVVANQAVTTYPGGVVAVRAKDFLGASRATLSVVGDGQAVSGSAVRDVQTTATSIWSAPVTAYQGASDTLVIPFSSLGLETAATNGMTYNLFASLRIVGDWDTTNSDTYRASDQHQFLYACGLGYHGDSSHATDASFASALYLPRHRPHYIIVQFASVIGSVVGTETLRIRAYVRTGTTIEFLIDQIYLIPYVFSGVKLGVWRAEDFARVGLSNIDGASAFVDGADSGDANGKFTHQPYNVWEAPTNFTGSDGGGDYQKKSAESSAEYAIRLLKEDFYFLVNSQPTPDAEADAYAYSIHGTAFRAAATWVNDTFSRTENAGLTEAGSSWGTSPEGFGWKTSIDESGPGGAATYAAVDGSKGVFHHGGSTPGAASVRAELGSTDGTRARVRAEDFTVSGKVLVTSPSSWYDVNTFANIWIIVDEGQPNYYIVIHPLEAKWWLKTGNNSIITGPYDISAWYAEDSYIGWKLEIKRYLIRVKVWDATGAEPGAWSYEAFRGLANDTSVYTEYPYSDDLSTTARHGVYHLELTSGHTDAIAQWETHWDDIKMEYDPYGSAGKAYASIEQPHGTKISEQEIPYGAWQFVYWGKRDWTELDAGFPAYLAFSAKTWNETGTAELQRCETSFWYFRSSRPEAILSMNWLSAESPHVSTVYGGIDRP